MKNVRALVFPALGAAVAFAFVHAQTACSSSSAAPSTGNDSGTDGGGTGDIIIGFSDSLSGGISGLGIPLVQVANVAEQQVNQVGVLGGRHIHIDVFDDLSDPTVGAFNAANHFIGENVPAVLGPLASGQCLGVPDGGTGGMGDLNNLYASHMILEISPSATSPLLTTDQPMTNRFFFRTAPADDFQGKAVALLMHDGVMPLADAGAPSGGGDGGDAGGGSGLIGGGCNNAYLVNGDDDYGNGLMAVVSATFTGKGGIVLGHDTVSTTLAPSYANEAQKVVGATPDCLVLVTYSDVGAQFMRDLRTAMNAPAGMPLTFPVYGSDGEYDSNFIPDGEATAGNAQGPNVTEGVIGTTPDPAPPTTEYAAFRAIWQQSFPGTEPPAYGANLYDAILVLALAIEKAGVATQGTEIRDALYKVTASGVGATTITPDKFVQGESDVSSGIPIEYVGASGPMSFDQSGNVTGSYVVWSVPSQASCSTTGGCFNTIARIDSSMLQ
jgi:branched-chain amino acid transport system substrate-binding protein